MFELSFEILCSLQMFCWTPSNSLTAGSQIWASLCLIIPCHALPWLRRFFAYLSATVPSEVRTQARSCVIYGNKMSLRKVFSEYKGFSYLLSYHQLLHVDWSSCRWLDCGSIIKQRNARSPLRKLALSSCFVTWHEYWTPDEGVVWRRFDSLENRINYLF
jgi:hypothetical protein